MVTLQQCTGVARVSLEKHHTSTKPLSANWAKAPTYSQALTVPYSPTGSRSCAQNHYYATLKTDGSNSPYPLFGLRSVIGKNLSTNYQIWPPFRKTNGHRCSFPFYRLFMSCKFLLQKSGIGVFHVLMAQSDRSPLWQTLCSNTNDIQSHKTLAAVCCWGCLPIV